MTAVQGIMAKHKAERILQALSTYHDECNRRRRVKSQAIFGHPGAHIPEHAPTHEGRVQAVAKALMADA